VKEKYILRRVYLTILFLLIMSVPAAFSQKKQSTLQKSLEPVIERVMRENAIPGLAVGIVQDGEVIWAKGFGAAKPGAKQAISAQSDFYLASITKLFTATAVMQLVEQNKVNLDDRVTGYLPYFKLKDERYKQITVRHLLNHTSGLGFIEENPFERKADYDPGALERHIRALENLTLNSAPGEKYEYSNEGFDILGDIIAKVSKSTYEDYIERHILKPLKMKNSTVLVSRQIPPRYFSDERGKINVNQKVPYNRAFAPSSALSSNVDDMNRWMIASLNRGALEGKRILQPASYDAMWKLPVQTEGAKEFPVGGRMGGGWFRWNYKNHQIVGHGGAELGFNSFLALAPNNSIGVVVLGNLYPAKANYSPGGTYYCADIAKAVLDLML
jgi:CubicO group peptidase (beta-lactamase class C family)